eukprot:gnl/TRDRNA2_/TRDRNA2_167593_c1_seq2.p1 gnl/TRDRNA2_/TRDRNA2_167593_c1~~gnl/TRDRNA2_/TRDRNA2_167593_c1_seq2.p1  ORF type:complete len:194 (+),score=63.77 gnl/TRDRNA2_/TRDRNA2_167593_c1_seq2:90-671(+)
MPATAGRVPMPSNNRLSVSDSLQTHEVWQKSVGYDPYAGADEKNDETIITGDEINSSAKGLFRLAQLTGNSSTLAPGACKRCGQVGHLYFQCRNNMKLKSSKGEEAKPAPVEEEEEDDPDSDNFGASDDDDDSDSDSDDDSDDDSDSSSSSSSSSEKKKKKSKKRKRSKKDKKDKKKKKKKKDKKDKKKKRKH